jgi:NodT family efflux transporter outer membrane factor (OMF) lipoprotein
MHLSFVYCAALTLLTSCALSMSRQERFQNALPPPCIGTSVAQAIDEPFFEPGPWPERGWWRAYGSAELNFLVDRALQCNPTIQAVHERICFAKSQATIARSKLSPLVYFDADYEYNYLSQNGLYRALNPTIPLSNQLIDLSLSFFYEFDFWGKYRNLYQAALGKQRAAIAETAQAELITSAALAQAYFALKTNLIRRDLYRQLYDIRRDYFALQAEMQQSALYSALTPLLSQEALFEARQWLYEIEQEIAVEVHIVNVLAGRGPDEPIGVCEPLLPLPTALAIPCDLSMQLLARRPDLMAQLWRVEALAREVGAAKADFWPDINITTLIGLQAGSWSKLFEWASGTFSALPALTLPIYTAGAIGANVCAKKALFNEALFQYNELILTGFQQVADLLAIGQAVYGEHEEQAKIVANASRRYELTRQRQQKGIDNLLTAYQFQEQMIEQKLEEVQLLYQQYVVSIALTRALGGGYFCAGGNLCE